MTGAVRTLLRSTAASALLLVSGLAAAHGPAGPEVEPVRELQYSTYLRVNTTNAHRTIVKGVCEHEGIRQIARILRGSEVEEMWAFLPRANGGQECQWHEIGREEKSERNRAYLRVDLNYVRELMAQNDEIHLVHFHPLRYFECAAQAHCPKNAPRAHADRAAKRWLNDLVYSMPSPSDVHFMMNMTSRYSKAQPEGRMAHKVVTPYGVVDYGLTAKGVARFESEQHGRGSGFYITMVMASALDDERLEAVARENPRNIGTAVDKLARSLNTEFLRVTHTPH